MGQNRSIFKDVKSLLVLTIFSNILNLARNLVVARIMAPSQMGLCLSLMVIPQIANYLNLGLVDGLTFIGPFEEGRSGKKSSDHVRSNIFNFSILVSVVFSLGVIGYGLFFPSSSPQVRGYIFCAAFLTTVWQPAKFIVANLAAERRFQILGLVELAYAAFLLASSYALILFFNGLGFWLALIMTNIILVCYGAYDYLKHWKLDLKVLKIKEILKWAPIGLTISFSSSISLPFLVIAKIFISLSMGVQAVGYFVIAIIILTLASLIPRASSRVMFPHMSVMRGQGQGHRDIWGLFGKAQVFSLTIMAFVVLLGYMALGPMVLWLLPKYAAGIPAAKVMLIAMLPYALIDNANNVLIISQHKRVFLLIYGLAVLTQCLTLLVVFLLGATIFGAAVSFVFAFLCYAVVLHCVVFGINRSSRKTDIPYGEFQSLQGINSEFLYE